jgi:glutaredoxin 3
MAASTSEVQSFVDNFISSHIVANFTKSYCPYSKKAKEVFAQFPSLIGYGCVDIDLDAFAKANLDAVQDYLKEKTGGRSVPRVFIKGAFFGGGDDTKAAFENGTLQTKLEEAGALPRQG